MVSSAEPSRKTLLIVEDNAIAREGLAVVLRREGYNVVTVANGQEALDYLRKPPPPDLILLDMLLPVLDGWHFLERLKANKTVAAAPVIVTTGTILTREWATAHGCAGFVRKPIECETLMAEIHRCLGDEKGKPSS